MTIWSSLVPRGSDLNHIRVRSGRQVYAGSAFSVSPSPTALPLP
ncbi:hypothetical protein HKB01_05140, partial [Vibrio parahaemolyticus]|nr:hypothetical protein [Vibrio parahaemolyticus]